MGELLQKNPILANQSQIYGFIVRLILIFSSMTYRQNDSRSFADALYILLLLIIV